MRYEACRIDYIVTSRLNMADVCCVVVDGQTILVCSKQQAEGVKDFFTHGYHTKLLNKTQINHIMKVIGKYPELQLLGLHPITGEPLYRDKPIKAGEKDLYCYEDVQLHRIVQ